MTSDNKNIQLSTLFTNLEELIALVKADALSAANAASLAAEKAELSRLAILANSTKIDAIKAMLDSAVYGMQKMSSNLDDIMVKLDV
jgi:hypothetical protein